MAALSDLSTPSPIADGRYSLDVPTGWRQGRGTFGGLTIGALVRAIEHAVGDSSRTVRSLTAELPGATAAGPADITVEILRKGNSVTTARASLVQGGETKAHVVGVVAATRRGHGPLSWQELTRPEAPPWSAVEPLAMGTEGWPEFATNLEYRLVEGMPQSGASTAVGWIRARHPGGLRDTGHIVAMMDAWWPVAINRLPTVHPMATIVYSLEVIAGIDGLNPESPLLYRATSPVLADGYCLETRELWGEDGRLVAINHQTIAIIA